MRKVALMAGLLSVFSLGYAYSWGFIDEKYGYEAKELEVRANVVKPLDLYVEGVDFGNVPAGKIKDHVDKVGKIEVKGSSNETVRFFILENHQNLGDANTLVLNPIKLKHSNGDVIEYTPEFTMNDEVATTSATTYALNEEGKVTLFVKGKVDAGAAKSLGEYKNNLIVRVKYE